MWLCRESSAGFHTSARESYLDMQDKILALSFVLGSSHEFTPQHPICRLLCMQVLVLWSWLCPMDCHHSATVELMSPGGREKGLQD